MKQAKTYARIGAGSSCLAAVVSFVVALLWYLSADQTSVFSSGQALSPRIAAAIAIGSLMLVTSIGFLFFPRVAAIAALLGAAVVLVLLVISPFHVGAAKGLGLLLAGPVLASLGVLRSGWSRAT